jgi:hypothetical protein
VTTPPAQLWSEHGVLAGAYMQAPVPGAQAPPVPQGAEPMQLPAQQTELVPQIPLLHWLLFVQEPPAATVDMQCPRAQVSPGAQSELVLHEEVQAPPEQR